MPVRRASSGVTEVRSLQSSRVGGHMAAPTVRRADCLMALAYGTDLATGHSRDFALRSCVLAMRMADAARLDEPMRRAVYHQALLRYIGCNADSHLLAAAWGDEIALRRELQGLDFGDKAEFAAVFVRALTRLFTGMTASDLAEAVQRGLSQARQVNVPILSGHCEVAKRIGELTVPVATWMRPAALTERETDAARLHPYHGERALTCLGGDGKRVAALVQRHHERLDGSGYYRNARSPDLSPAAARMRAAVREGSLCPDAVEA